MWVRACALGPLPPVPGETPDQWTAAIDRQRASGLDLVTVARITATGDLGHPIRGSEAAAIPPAVDSLPVERRQLVATAPYTACAESDVPASPAAIAAATDRLVTAVEAAPDCDAVILADPGAVTCPPAREDAVAAALDRAAAAATTATVIWYPWGGAVSERLHALVYDTAVTVMAHDLVAARDRNLYAINEYRGTDPVGFGLADASGAVVLSATALGDRLRSVRDAVPAQSFDGVYLLPSRPPTDLSWDAIDPLFDAIATAAHSR